MRLARATSGRERVTDDASFSVEELADKSRSAHRLLYRTPPLSQRLTLSGLASVRLEVSFDAPASNLSAALVDLGPKSGTTVLSKGWADPQKVDSLHEGTALEPRTRYAIEVDLDQVLQHRLPSRLPSGHRLALVVAASDKEFTLRPPPGTHLRLTLSEASLDLPVLGGADALRNALRP